MRSANKLITDRDRSVIKKFQILCVARLSTHGLMVCCKIPYFLPVKRNVSTLKLAAASCNYAHVFSSVHFNPSNGRRQATQQTVKCSHHCLKTTPAMHACATEHLCSHSALIPEILPTLTLILISYHSREDKQSLRPESRTHYQMSRSCRGLGATGEVFVPQSCHRSKVIFMHIMTADHVDPHYAAEISY